MSEPGFDVSNHSAPASYAASVTPSDSTNFSKTARGLYVGTGGDLVVILPNGDAITFTNVQDGTVLPVRCDRVNSTSTTASDIIALY